MRLCLDACVLFPTVLRELLLGVAKTGAFRPIWSERILEEWARAARKLGPTGEPQVRAEIVLVRADWPEASVEPRATDMARLWLPDENDVHVLGAAIAGSADGIVTFNAKDFPRNTLADEGLIRFSPDQVLLDHWRTDPAAVASVVQTVHQTACTLSGEHLEMRQMLKRARVPRLGKALSRTGS
ncbi:MAG: PIN domain-containing protein [Pseudomonadota bacterium]